MSVHTKMIKMSVIIPTYNKAIYLDKTLAALAANDCHNVEIIIVDNGSSDHTKEIVNQANLPFDVHYFYYEKKGRSCARNFGVENAKGEILLFLDDDILVENSFFLRHKDFHKNNQCTMLRGKLVDLIEFSFLYKNKQLLESLDNTELRRYAYQLNHRKYLNVLERMVDYLFKNKGHESLYWLAGSGGNISFPKSIWEKLEGFDTRFGDNWGCEDLEFAYRAIKNNVMITYSKLPIGYHFAPTVSYDKQKEQEKNLDLFYSLHPDKAVESLKYLLSPNGNQEKYFSELNSCYH